MGEVSRRKRTGRIASAEEQLLTFALGYPEAWLDHPWGENAVKVKKRVFLFLGRPNDRLTLSVKLPDSGFEALLLPFTEPTRYGLGKHGWVSSKFGPGDDVPIDLIEEWIEESFRAVAPKKVVTLLEGTAG